MLNTIITENDFTMRVCLCVEVEVGGRACAPEYSAHRGQKRVLNPRAAVRGSCKFPKVSPLQGQLML